MQEISKEMDVLIVGLGPVGAAMAGLLRAQGLSVLVIEREADVYPLPRAGAFDDEGMRILQSFGFADIVRPMCRVMDGYEFLTADRRLMLRFDLDDQIGRHGWASTYCFHQPDLERALRQHLASMGVETRLNTALVGLNQDAEGVVAELAGPSGRENPRAKYLIGCDGANSMVRKAIGGDVFDYGFSESWLVIDALVRDKTGLPDIATQICDPHQPMTFMHMTGDRYRWEFMLTPQSDPETFASEESVQRLMARWDTSDRLSIERRSLYRFRGLVAERWRKNRVLIAGDAAHLMPPFLGQGMCSGFRDAANLAWKLAAILKHGASDDVLDTYQQEREPHARGIIERSIELGQMICVLDPEVAAERDTTMLAMREQGITPPLIPLPALQEGCLFGGAESGELFPQPIVNGIRLDDRLGHAACLISIEPCERPALAGLHQVALGAKPKEPLVPPLMAWLEERNARAVLIRPDRHVFGIGHPEELFDAWQKMLGVSSAHST